MAGKSQKQLRLRLPSPPPLALPPGELSAQPTERGTQPHSPPPAKTRRPLRLHRRRGLRFSEKSLAAFAARRRQIKCNPFFAAACTSQKTLLSLQVWNLFAFSEQIMRAADCKPSAPKGLCPFGASRSAAHPGGASAIYDMSKVRCMAQSSYISMSFSR